MLHDAVSVTLAYLRSRLAITTITFGTRRPTDWPRHLPFVLVERLSGAAADGSDQPSSDDAGVSVQCWDGPQQSDARALANVVLHVLSRARGSAIADATIARVVQLAGPTSMSDEATPQYVHGYSATLQLTVQ